MFEIKLQKLLEERRQNHLLRKRFCHNTACETDLLIDNKKYLSFSSNNYLGLANHPIVRTQCKKAISKYGIGSGSAYLISGYTFPHQALEEALAHFLNFPRVLLFSSGYMANLGVLYALTSIDAMAIFADKYIHASLLDGCVANKIKLRRYPHCHMGALETLCSPTLLSNKLIVSEGLFGMDGTIAPLHELHHIAKKYQAMTLLDDAHGIGVMGASGRGTLEHHKLSHTDITFLTGTLGKAFGSYGAFVASSTDFIEAIVQLARTYLYTTALPPIIAIASLESLKIIQNEPWRREKLFSLINYFTKCTQQLGLPFVTTQTPIQPLLIGDNQKAIMISQRLLTKNIFVKAILPPTVPHNKARLRITLTSLHTHQHIDYLLETLADVFKES